MVATKGSRVRRGPTAILGLAGLLRRDLRRKKSWLGLAMDEGDSLGQMRITLVNSKDLDGGATRAARRLKVGLECVGAEVKMFVQQRKGDGNGWVVGPETTLEKLQAFVRPTLDRLPLRSYRDRVQGEMWSPNWLPHPGFRRQIARTRPEIVNIHWLGDGFVSMAEVAQLPYPLIFTMHDMWNFTGGCHYDRGCGRFSVGCGECPLLGSKEGKDLSSRRLAEKVDALNSRQVFAISPSKWLADLAARSPAFNKATIKVVPNGLDRGVFKPIDRVAARDAFSLPRTASIVLFGAIAGTTNPRKGYHLLVEALKSIETSPQGTGIHLVTFGGSIGPDPAELPFPSTHIGQLTDDIALALLYNACDVMVVPSVQEVFGQTASEALACGTPVVGFADTGVAEIVQHKVSGYLAQHGSATDLCNGIEWVLKGGERISAVRAAARESTVRFDHSVIGQAHMEIFSEVTAAYRR